MTLEDEHTGHKQVRRVPLEGAATAAQAKQKLEDLRVNRRKGKLPVLKLTPKFSDFADSYLAYYKQARDAKRASTMETEGYAIDRLKGHLGHLRLDKIKRTHVDHYIAKRQGAGLSARTVNLEITILRNVLNKALTDKWITYLPTENLRPLKSKPRKRELVSAPDIEKLCSVGFQPVFREGGVARPGEAAHPLVNAQQFADYIRLMSHCGARLSETLCLRWADVNWETRQLRIGADGMSKNGQVRFVDFNADLESHLRDMFTRKAPDSEWLFPSPRRGGTDRPLKTFRESLVLARQAAGMARFGFHDCRHHFISRCVMAGIDFLTIAKWVGHQDGGILIATVYGHLSDDHSRRMATRLTPQESNGNEATTT
jgi:integrase